jgi:transcriptional regulator with XRE-family HTH domain
MQPMIANTKEDFAKRLNDACDEAVPKIVSGRGRIAELRRRVSEQGKDLSGESVRKWLSGDTIPSMDNIRFIATALNVLADWLLTSRGDRYPTTRAKAPAIAVGSLAETQSAAEPKNTSYSVAPTQAAFGSDEETLLKGFRVADTKDREQIIWLCQRALDNFGRRSEKR